MSNKNAWYRLDNSAMVYPMVITLKNQSLFRLGARLTTKVEPHYLNIAVNTALERFPYFKVELKKGLFRHYFDENSHSPLVEEYDGVLLKIINFRHNRNYLFRVTYYDNAIFIDYFHGLCDGTGGLEFLKTVLYYYFKASNNPISRENVMTMASPVDEGETEDGFKKYFKKFDFAKGLKKMAGGNAYRAKDRQFACEGYGLIEGTVSTDALVQAARDRNCSVTVFVSALALLAVAKTYGSKEQKNDYYAFIPINLRRRFPSKTMFNFTNFAKCRVPKNAEPNLDVFIDHVKSHLKEQLGEEELQIKLSFSSLMDKNPILRYMPLFIKGFFSRLVRGVSLQSKQTMIISNLGEPNFGDAEKIASLIFNLNCAEKAPINLGVVSYKGKTLISFTRRLVATKIEQCFFRLLGDMCGEVEVGSNYREDCRVL